MPSRTCMSYFLPSSVVNPTKRIGVMEAKVYGDGYRLVALATGTFYIQSART